MRMFETVKFARGRFGFVEVRVHVTGFWRRRARVRFDEGPENEEEEEYQAGDDVRMIDWKVTARSGKTHTKLFVEERERPVLLVVDFRAGMRFGTQGMYKHEVVSEDGYCMLAKEGRCKRENCPLPHEDQDTKEKTDYNRKLCQGQGV